MDPITGRSAGGGWKLDRLINWSAAATITTTCACTPMFPVLWVRLVPKPFGSINTTCACTPMFPVLWDCLVPKPFGSINTTCSCTPNPHVPRSVGSSCARTFGTINHHHICLQYTSMFPVLSCTKTFCYNQSPHVPAPPIPIIPCSQICGFVLRQNL